MKRLTLAALAVMAGSVTAPACLSVAGASEVPGLPNCGGNAQGAAVNPTVPWDCGNAKTIAGIVGSPVVGRLHLSNGSGTASVTVTVTLPAPQAFDVTLAGFWHLGKSSGPETALSNGVIPAGQTTATVTTNRTGICNGQFDFQVNKPPTVGKSDLYRLHGPWLTVPNCLGTQVSVPPPPITPSVPPAAVTPAPPVSTVGGTLPATGAGPYTGGEIALIAVIVGVLGGGLLLVAGWRRP